MILLMATADIVDIVAAAGALQHFQA